ncbi:hypothetical protein [Burkholderia cenocepacia]|uniref:Uncharacterized protein n=1 Tax=Burkholderia cenocepacia TaxID=95486 RepID=A0A6B2MPC9_9BURK|nr:hypothetical protein [Burkholderia cenocepacia]NDV77330.1 hypothetical protein [Burkholderia cenocepacia]
MTRATWMKFFAGVLLFGIWLGLVLARLAPAPALIDAIGYALVGLGIYHATAADGQLVMKFAAGILLFGAWLTLVVMHLAPTAGLIDAIGYTLAGLGIYQAKGILPLPARYGVVTGDLVSGVAFGAATTSAVQEVGAPDPTAPTAAVAEPAAAAPGVAPVADAPAVAQAAPAQ